MEHIKRAIITEYWQKKLSGEIPKLSLPFAPGREVENTLEPMTQSIPCEIPPHLAEKLFNSSKNSDIALFILFLSGIEIALSRYTGIDDVLMGTVASAVEEDGRSIVFCRNRVCDRTTIKEFIIQTKTEVMEAIKFKGFSPDEMVEILKAKSSTDTLDIFNAAFLYEPFQRRNKSIDRFSLIFILSKQKNRLVLQLEALSFCSPAILTNLSQNVIAALGRMLANTSMEIGMLDIINPEEKNRLIYEFNNTGAEYPRDKTLPQFFEEQVERTPDQVALVSPGGTSAPDDFAVFPVQPVQPVQQTYRQLNEKSDCLARLLIEQGVLPDTIVGIMIERSVEMIIGIMGILKAGGAYMPIDTENPQERIDFILEDSGAKILVSDRNSVGTGQRPVPILDLIHVVHDEFGVRTGNNGTGAGHCPVPTHLPVTGHRPPVAAASSLTATSTSRVGPANLAYIIYTSGSTGQPKGVLIEHGPAVNVLVALNKRYPFSPVDVYLLKTSYTFDVSVTELFGWYLGGGRLAILEAKAEKDPQKIADAIEYFGISHINFVPSMFGAFLEILEAERSYRLSSLKYIFLAGEAVMPGLVRRFKQLTTVAPGILLENIYGPTENTVYTSWYSLSGWEGSGNTPIGKPLPNVKLYILDRHGYLQPIGVPGELGISGAGLARGYLNRPGLTGERFISNPEVKGGGMYRSGDLSRWLPDGNIEFLGRIDHQVKVRGYRIEMGEIENRLLNHAEIKEAVVVNKTDENGNNYLSAYFVSNREIPGTELSEYLLKSLPQYMVPSYFTRLGKIPLTANGKIDRKALPAQESISVVGYVAPRHPVEEKLAMIWAGVLGKESLPASAIGIDTNFFRLGGHSLKATTLVHRIHKELKVKIPLGVVFKRPTIRKLSEYIRGSKEAAYADINPVEKKEYYRLSSAQKRMYFLQQLDLNSVHYNIPLILPIGKELEKDGLEVALKQLIERHESLRTSFIKVKEEVFQRIHTPGTLRFSLDYYEVDETQGKEIIRNYIKPFDLSKAPLMHSGIIKLPDGNQIWMVDIHHIVSDGVSHTILTEDFLSLYNGYKENKGIELDPLPIRYKDFAQWQNRLIDQGEIKPQEEYWLELYSGEIPRLNLPTDGKRPEVFTFEGDHYGFGLEREDAEKLKIQGAQHDGTLYMNMLAVLNVLLYKYTGQEDIIIGSGIAGRRHTDLSGVVGMFVNTLAMRNNPHGEMSYENFLLEVIAGSVKAFENQDVQFETLVEKLNLERDLSRNPLFDIMMMVQNFMPGGQAGRRRSRSTIPGSKGAASVTGEDRPQIEYKKTTANFDITLFVHELADELYIYIEYYTAIFKPATIHRLTAHLKNTVKAIIAHPTIKLKDIEIIAEEEKKWILCDLNNTGVAGEARPGNKTIHKLFADQVEQRADRIALEGPKSEAKNRRGDSSTHPVQPVQPVRPVQLTYRELNERADRLAGWLLEKSVQPDTIVGIMMERSIELIIGMVGILKAGGAYMPIDPEYPGDRVDYMLKDSGTQILVTTGNLVKEGEKLKGWEGEKIFIEEIPVSLKNSTYPLTFLPSKKLPSKSLTDSDFLLRNSLVIDNRQFTIDNLKFSNEFLVLKNEQKRSDARIEASYLRNSSNPTAGRRPQAASLAYVIYTSGSTGKPKGVMVEHHNVVRLVKNPGIIEFNENQRLLAVGAMVFDITTFEIWGPLLNGMNLHVVGKEVILDAEKLKTVVIKHNITILHLIPQLLKEVQGQYPETFAGLEYFLVGGDLVPPDPVNKLKNRYPQLKVLHCYGPTENTTFTTTYRVEKECVERIPIGKPIAETQVYILDKHGYVQPIGIGGELLAGGGGVARGYLNNPEMTYEKFCLRKPGGSFRESPWHGHPISENRGSTELMISTHRANLIGSPRRGALDPLQKLFIEPHATHHSPIYKTGDLARWLPDPAARGAYIIEFLGRIDTQVKIRGFRIELGEIENQLLGHERILDTVAVVKEVMGNRYICAYIVPDMENSAQPLDPGRFLEDLQLREYLSGILPDYMIPSFFIPLEKIPQTPQGKVDRKALPDPVIKGSETYVPPGDEYERKLAKIWGEVLGIEKENIGIYDNFFRLGGDSLKALTIIARIYKELKVKVSIFGIFKYLNISELAKYTRELVEDASPTVNPVEKKEYYVLSSAQKRMYFIQEMDPGSTAYNITEILPWEGSDEKEKLDKTVKELLNRHESMRTSIRLIDNQPVQIIHEAVEFQIDFYPVGEGESQRVIKNFVKPFDLGRAPFFRVGIINEGTGKKILIIDLHHIISDGISRTLLREDFLALYQGKKLARLKLQYKDYSEWQNTGKYRGLIEKQQDYWWKEFESKLPVLNLVTDNPRPGVMSWEGDSVGFTIGKEETKRLKEIVDSREATLFMVLLAIYSILLAKLSGQEEILIGTPVVGRMHGDLYEIIGIFTNTLVLRTKPRRELYFAHFLDQVKEKTLEAFDNQEYPFESLVKQIAPAKDLSRHPIFDIAFSLQNFSYPTWGQVKVEKVEKAEQQQLYVYENPTTKFDLALIAVETEETLQLAIQYSTRLFKRQTIQRYCGYYQKIVSAIATGVDFRQGKDIELRTIKISHDLFDGELKALETDTGDFEF